MKHYYSSGRLFELNGLSLKTITAGFELVPQKTWQTSILFIKLLHRMKHHPFVSENQMPTIYISPPQYIMPYLKNIFRQSLRHKTLKNKAMSSPQKTEHVINYLTPASRAVIVGCYLFITFSKTSPCRRVLGQSAPNPFFIT